MKLFQNNMQCNDPNIFWTSSVNIDKLQIQPQEIFEEEKEVRHIPKELSTWDNTCNYQTAREDLINLIRGG